MEKRRETSDLSDAEIEAAVERFEKGDAWDETDEVVQIEVKKPLTIVVPVRLSEEKWKELRAEAKELGIGPSTLVRMWVLDRLRQIEKNKTRIGN
jgi:hypothetical protein